MLTTTESETSHVRQPCLGGLAGRMGDTADGRNPPPLKPYEMKNGIFSISTGWPDFFHQFAVMMRELEFAVGLADRLILSAMWRTFRSP